MLRELASFAPPRTVFSPAAHPARLAGARAPPLQLDGVEIPTCAREREGLRAVILTVTFMTLATIAIAAVVLVPRLREERVVFGIEPDRPVAFGYKMAWLALRTTDTVRVAELIGIADAEPCNWRSGIGTIYDGDLGDTHIFVTPPVAGWTFVVGLPIPHPVGHGFVDKCTPLLLDLGLRVPEVQYYFTYPLIDFYAWVRIKDGRLLRAFAIGDAGVVWNKGRTTREEKALGLKLFELRGVRARKGDSGAEMILYPTEDHVMSIARGWSLDPTALELRSAEPAIGYVGRAPLAWRPERLRQTG
jgi:hypothetical protein